MRGDNEGNDQSVHNEMNARRNETVPWNNAGRQSDPNTERTLGHVGPSMGGVMTLLNKLMGQHFAEM